MEHTTRTPTAEAAQKRAERSRLRQRGIVPLSFNVPEDFVAWIDGVKKAHRLKSRDATLQFIADRYRALSQAQEGSPTN
jgi:hypothetical protein